MMIVSRIRSFLAAEGAKLRSMTFSQKADYLVTYYKWWFLGIVMFFLALGLIGDVLIQSQKEIVLQGYFTNDDLNYFPGEQMEDEYAALLNLDRDHRVVFDDTLYFDLEGTADQYTAASNGKVIATMAINQLDFMVTTGPVLEHFKGEVPMKDLEEFLPEDILEALRDQLVPGLDETGQEAYVGISMASSRYLRDLNPEVEFFLFIPYRNPNEAALLDFLRYCFDLPNP